MFGKAIYKVDYEELMQLIENRDIFEGYKLDFKREFSKKSKELAKDVSSFANTSGGFLIYGIDDKTLQATGVPKDVGGKNVVEWFNQVVSGNVTPNIYYREPHCIEIPNSDKILLIVEIPESSRKPHMVNDDFKYYIRVNDSSKTANHYQVRDMFNQSKLRKNNFEEFYLSRNLDPKGANFCLNSHSENLDRNYKRVEITEGPIVLFSVIPKYLDKEILKGSSKDHISWLETNRMVEIDDKASVVMYNPRYGWESTLDGYYVDHSGDGELKSYFEVLTNGYIEFGSSKSFCYGHHEQALNKNMIAVYLDLIVGYSIALLTWSRRFYEHCGYNDEFLFQVSFLNVLHCRLYGFKDKFNYMYYRPSHIMNKHNGKFRIQKRISVGDLVNGGMDEIAQEINDKVSRAFGFTEDVLFTDGKYPYQKLRNFEVYGLS